MMKQTPQLIELNEAELEHIVGGRSSSSAETIVKAASAGVKLIVALATVVVTFLAAV